MASELERSRDLTRVIVHVDMDAFYAAVEMRDCPELKDKPMAVGSMSMLVSKNMIWEMDANTHLLIMYVCDALHDRYIKLKQI